MQVPDLSLLPEWNVGQWECVGGGGPCGPTSTPAAVAEAGSVVLLDVVLGGNATGGAASATNGSVVSEAVSVGFTPFVIPPNTPCFAPNATHEALLCNSSELAGADTLPRERSTRNVIAEDRAEHGVPSM